MKVLVTFLCKMNIEVQRNITECSGLPKLSERLASVRISSTQFNDLWQKILNKVQRRLAPFLTLVKLLGGDHIEQALCGIGAH